MRCMVFVKATNDSENGVIRRRAQCRAGGPAGCHSDGGLNLGWQESLRNLARLVEPEINQ
jgi:hypothetical protein